MSGPSPDEIAWSPFDDDGNVAWERLANEGFETKEPAMPQPAVGEILYLNPKGTLPVRVVRTEGTQVWFVPAYVTVRHTEQGNLYDGDGNRKYMV